METNNGIIPYITLPKLELIIKTYYLFNRDNPNIFVGALDLSLFANSLTDSKKLFRNQISASASFLNKTGILESTNNRKYRLTGLGKELGQAIKDDLDTKDFWLKVVRNYDFLSEIYNYIMRAKQVDQEDLKKEIIRLSGNQPNFGYYTFGALTIINILEKGGYIIKKGVDFKHKNILPNFDELTFQYVEKKKVDILRSFKNYKYDLSKLIRLCEEANICYENDLYYAVGMLTRAIIDHIPPIFGFKEFSQVANNFGTRSFKESMGILDNSSKKIVDDYLHGHIKQNENLANLTFAHSSSPALDRLIGEVIAIINE